MTTEFSLKNHGHTFPAVHNPSDVPFDLYPSSLKRQLCDTELNPLAPKRRRLQSDPDSSALSLSNEDSSPPTVSDLPDPLSRECLVDPIVPLPNDASFFDANDRFDIFEPCADLLSIDGILGQPNFHSRKCYLIFTILFHFSTRIISQA